MSSEQSTIARRTVRPGIVAAFVGVTVLAWLLVVARMRGMDAGPGTDLGSLGWYVGIWVTMMAAMMLPSATPMVMLFAKVSEQSARRPGSATALFVTGYLVAWTAFGLVAYGLFRLVRELDPAFLAWNRAGPEIAGAAIVLAGAYQLTPMKRVCLRNCRTPLSFVMHHWQDGTLGAVRMGIEHGAWCIGCCWALMVLLFAVGVMSITWMLVVAAIVLAEKVLPVGEQIARWLAVVLIALGVWVALAPGSVPGLTIPGAGEMMDSMLPLTGVGGGVIDATAPVRLSPWRIRGAYFESCNCEAICPCRMVGGVRGGRSTYGICFGVLSWLVSEGYAGDIDLSGLAAAFVIRYDDDERGSPWSFVVHVDERGSQEQRDALAAILTGELGGESVLRLPWNSKPSNLLDVRASPIEIIDGPDGHELRVGRVVRLRASTPYETDEVVACGIPGYDHPGTELLADELVVDDAPFAWELSGNCAFASPFDYSS